MAQMSCSGHAEVPAEVPWCTNEMGHMLWILEEEMAVANDIGSSGCSCFMIPERKGAVRIKDAISKFTSPRQTVAGRFVGTYAKDKA